MTRPWYNHPPEQGLPMLGRIVRRTTVGPLALLVALLTFMAGLVGVAPAQAAPAAVKPGPTAARLAYAIDPGGKIVPLSADAKARTSLAPQSTESLQSCTPEPDGKCYWFSNGMFAQRNICFQNNVGIYWNYVNAQQGFQSGSSTVTFYNHGANTGTPTSCQASPGWNDWQILTYTAYGTNDGHCARFYADVDGAGYYNANTTIYMNAAPDRPVTCTDTLQHRNNAVSTAIGTILGLQVFSSSTNLTAAVMNHYFVNSYNYPGVDDRNALYWRYLLQ
jgi:hypothetical protein